MMPKVSRIREKAKIRAETIEIRPTKIIGMISETKGQVFEKIKKNCEDSNK